MTMNDFFSFSELLKSALTTKKFDGEGEKFVWKDIKWLRFTKNIGILQYKVIPRYLGYNTYFKC